MPADKKKSMFPFNYSINYTIAALFIYYILKSGNYILITILIEAEYSHELKI